jgi:hypothetical protein
MLHLLLENIADARLPLCGKDTAAQGIQYWSVQRMDGKLCATERGSTPAWQGVMSGCRLIIIRPRQKIPSNHRAFSSIRDVHPFRKRTISNIFDIANRHLPFFVKPANAGSSVGVSKVTNVAEFAGALRAAFRYDKKLLIEEEIRGRQVECRGLGNEEPEASVVGEVLVPGFTNISMFPLLWEASGVSYSELIDRIVALALQRHATLNEIIYDVQQTAQVPDVLE